MIEVLQPGFHTSVQDLGRSGWRHLGVGASGAMDALALALANLMVGNDAVAAGLEVTMGHAAFAFREPAEVALGGADAQATLDGRPVPNWWAVRVRAGQVLRLGAPAAGMRTYVAMRGGIAVPAVLGSASTDLKGGFGGLDGRVLKRGDVLGLAPAAPAGEHRGFGLSAALLEPYFGGPIIHLLPAAQWTDLEPASRQQLVQAAWQVSPQSNRVGCRLDGPELRMRAKREMRSHGIVPGVVQLPPAGQPIVQLCDGNTCGGYPVIGTVIQADLHRYAQLRPRDTVRFAWCDMAYAQARWARRQRLLADVAARCALARRHLLPIPAGGSR